MTYQECEETINLYLPKFRIDQFFELSGNPARFLALIIAPQEADLGLKAKARRLNTGGQY